VEQLELETDAVVYLLVGIQSALLLPVLPLAFAGGSFGDWISVPLTLIWTAVMGVITLICGVLLFFNFRFDQTPLTDLLDHLRRVRNNRKKASAAEDVSDAWAEMERRWEEGELLREVEAEEVDPLSRDDESSKGTEN